MGQWTARELALLIEALKLGEERHSQAAAAMKYRGDQQEHEAKVREMQELRLRFMAEHALLKHAR